MPEITPENRTAEGKRSGMIGIACNMILSGGKILAGALSGSTSILADGLNNLSDAASSVVTLLGFKFAEKPADKEHPYGHARYEYVASLVVAMLMLVIGFELIKTSVEKILYPTATELSLLSVCVLVASILVKLFMMLYNRRLGKRIGSTVLMATAADSRNDVITTTAVLAAGVVEHLTEWKVDGFMGLAVAVFILYSGISLAKTTISPLLGEGANPELIKQITEYVESRPMVLGCHDLVVHDYGPGRCYASIHLEIDKDVDTMVCHEMIDKTERQCLKLFGTHLVIHYDPVALDDPEAKRLKKLITTVLKIKDERMAIHDFRVVRKEQETRLVFDIVLPEDLMGEKESICNAIEQAINSLEDKKYTFRITFDL